MRDLDSLKDEICICISSCIPIDEIDFEEEDKKQSDFFMVWKMNVKGCVVINERSI
jgi:hypothetical protein